MPKQTIVLISPAELSLESNQIKIVQDEQEYLRPIEDVRCLLIDNHSVHLTVPLLNKLSESNVAVVFCNERHLPISMLMDLASNGMQSKYIRGQIDCQQPQKKRIWKQIVEHKIKNQSQLLEKLGYDRNVLKPYYVNVKAGDTSNREGAAAKVYWKKLFGKDFIRDRFGDAPNNFLNYGYTLLRSFTSRAIMDAGLLPLIGVFHRNYYNSFPLADDLMEPYRPFVDEKVFELFQSDKNEVDKSVKQSILQVFYETATYEEIVSTARTLADIYVGDGEILYYPKLM